MWFFMQFFLQTNVYLNKWTRYSVHGISEQAIIYARHTWLVCVKRTGITASPKQSGDQVKTCSPVFLDHIRYEFSMIFFHGYDDTHTQSLSIFAIIYYPGLLKHCRTVMDPTTLQGPLPLFLIRLWRKSRMWNPFIMKIVVTSTCRRTKTLTITHLSEGSGSIQRVESILVERCWTPIFVGRASRVKGETFWKPTVGMGVRFRENGIPMDGILVTLTILATRCLAETYSPETIGWWPPNRLIDLRFVPRLD